MNRASKIYTALIFIFLFAPIAILLVFSFNEAKSLSVFSGVSFKWYRELFRDDETLNAVRNTLVLAVSASLISTVMGTAAAVGINKLRNMTNDEHCSFVLWVGSKRLIKRKKLEEYLDGSYSI